MSESSRNQPGFDECSLASADAEPSAARDLSLTPEQRRLCRFLKQSYGFSWPFAAHISKDVLAFLPEQRGPTDAQLGPGTNTSKERPAE
jgi:hypothetical protein